jgi:hypothetical protein
MESVERVAARVGVARRRTARLLTLLLGGVAGVVVGFALLTALARPAGAVSVPLPTSGPSAPIVSVPTVSVPHLSVPAVSVTRPESVPTLASVSQVATTTVAGLSSAGARPLGDVPLVVSNPGGSLATPVLGAVHAVAAPVTTGLRSLQIPPAGSSLIGFLLGMGSSSSFAPVGPVALNPPRTVGTSRAVVQMSPIVLPRAGARSQGAGAPKPVPAPFAPNQAPITPSTFLAANDLADTSAGQGGSPLGSLPPLGPLIAALAIGGVLLVRGTRPRLLLDARCSPPG